MKTIQNLEELFQLKLDGAAMYELARELFPICRSITGDGVRKTLHRLAELYEEQAGKESGLFEIHEVPSGTKVFDWEVPKEWNLKEAYIEDAEGNRIIDSRENNLHVCGYSVPVDCYMDKEELLSHVYVEESQPDAIPYVTSYYKERFGFCMSKTMRDQLPKGRYHAVIEAALQPGSLTYGELLLPGETEDEILISTYVCHPSMANNELSGPVVALSLAVWLSGLWDRRYSYRFLFIPETIGSITYLSMHLPEMKEHIKAGFLLSCVGDDRTYSYLPTRRGNTLSDRIAVNVLSFLYPEYHKYTFLDRGSDERQYNAPGVDLPVCVICRSKFGEYKEYHTSLDDLSLISPKGLEGSVACMQEILLGLEYNAFYQVTCLCEPQLGKRSLYPTISKKGSYDHILSMRDFLAYADGKTDLIEISTLIRVPIKELIPIIDKLKEHGLLVTIHS